MKRCPECRRDYYDDSLLYCLDDGSALLEGPGSVVGPVTAVFPNAHDTEAEQTRTFENDSSIKAFEQPFTRSKNSLLIAGAVGLLIFTALGIGVYWYYGRIESQISSIAVMPFVNATGN